MAGVANMVSGVDVDPNGRHWSSLLSFRFPQWRGVREVSNSRPNAAEGHNMPAVPPNFATATSISSQDGDDLAVRAVGECRRQVMIQLNDGLQVVWPTEVAMSRPTLEEAVLLAADCLYVEKCWEQPVLLSDVTRAVARIYGLPTQEPTQVVEVSRLQESKMLRPDGRDLDLVESDEKISLEEAVKNGALWLRNHGYAETYVRVNPVMRLTEAGSIKAKSIMQAQLLVDAGVKGRIQEYDPLNAPKDDPRLRPQAAWRPETPSPFDRSPEPPSRPPEPPSSGPKPPRGPSGPSGPSF
jgi:hypothetical protein